jgi:uncharacterized protein
MLEDGSKPRDIASLADEGAGFQLALPFARMQRLAQQLASTDGVAEGQVELGRERGFAMADVTVAATLHLVCQRCLGPVAQRVESQSRVLILESEADAGRVPPEFETVLAPEGRLRLADLIEEELLLALPIAPRHDNVADCPAASEAAANELAGPPEGGEVRRPFADLGALLGQGLNDERERRGKRRR